MEETSPLLFTYTHCHPTDGNIGVGNVSHLFSQILDNIATEYISFIPDKSATTHHTYYTELKCDLRRNFDQIQFAEFWKGVGNGALENEPTNIQKLINLAEMNEIYYSNPNPNFTSKNLYGAAANLIPHRDCILFHFPGIRVYRAIISATDGNDDTITEFIHRKIERRLNKGDYMVFDFDRTLHQVKKTGQTPTPRILLKLHFLAYNVRECPLFSMWYVRFAAGCYIVYYRVARYTEQLGTDPKTFAGFFFGILWEYPFYPEYQHAALVTYLGVVAALQKTHHIEVGINNMREVVLYSVLDMTILYLCIVTWFFARHIISSVKGDK